MSATAVRDCEHGIKRPKRDCPECLYDRAEKAETTIARLRGQQTAILRWVSAAIERKVQLEKALREIEDLAESREYRASSIAHAALASEPKCKDCGDKGYRERADG